MGREGVGTERGGSAAPEAVGVVGTRRTRAAAVAGLHGASEAVGGGEDVLSWIEENRRLSKDYEKLRSTSEAFVYVAMTRLMARRLART